jgi:hypothetical protein
MNEEVINKPALDKQETRAEGLVRQNYKSISEIEGLNNRLYVIMSKLRGAYPEEKKEPLTIQEHSIVDSMSICNEYLAGETNTLKNTVEELEQLI